MAGVARPWRSAAEIAAVSALTMVTLWVVGPQMSHSPAAVASYWLAMAVGALIVLRPVRGGIDGATRPAPPASSNGSLTRAWPVYLIATMVAGSALVCVAFWRDPQFARRIDTHSILLKFVGYLPLALIQAVAFFRFLQSRIRDVLGAALHEGPALSLSVAGLTGIAFSLCHAPNPAMMGLTLVAGIGWSWIYRARPNLWLLSLSHAVLGTIVHRVLLLNTRVGPFYERPDLHMLQSAIPGLRQLFGNLY